MAGEPHDVVKLLVARMESHPEEFRIGEGIFHQRWSHHIDIIQDHGSEADKAAITVKLRGILMDELHGEVLDELLNGPERRRTEREEYEYERNLSKSLTLTKQAYDYDLDKMVGVGTKSPSTKLDVSSGVLNSIRKVLK